MISCPAKVLLKVLIFLFKILLAYCGKLFDVHEIINTFLGRKAKSNKTEKSYKTEKPFSLQEDWQYGDKQ